MAIKDHKAKIRLFSIIFVVLFLLASAYGAWQFLQQNIFSAESKRAVVAEVNGNKIYKDEFEKEFYNMQNYSNQMLEQKKQQLAQMGIDTADFKGLPEDILRQYLIKTLIDRRVLLTSAKDLKVKVANSDINKQIEEMQKQIGGKDKFIQYINANGYNLTTFKNQLKNEMTITEIQKKIQESYKLSDEELQKVYNRYQYTAFSNQTFEEAKEQIRESLSEENSNMILSAHIEKALEKAKINFKDEEIKKLYENSKEAVAEQEGYKFLRSNLNEALISSFFSSAEGYSEEQVNRIIAGYKQNLAHLVEIMNKAKSLGIQADPQLVGISQLSDYSKKYFDYLVDNHQPSDADMQARFNEKRSEYNIKNTISGYVVGEEFQPKQRDFDILKTRADEVMKTITKENFAAKARELSQDPGSKDNGGNLGTNVDITGFVPEFAEAIKKAKAGEIVGPVKTEFGYHIIYVHSKDANNENIATASHILLTPSISDETRKEVMDSLAKLKEELNSKKITWQEVETQDKYKYSIKEQFRRLTKSDSIPGIGNDTELTEKLFNTPINQIIGHTADFGEIMLVKTEEIAAKEVSFEEVKERIRLEIALEYANKELGNLE